MTDYGVPREVRDLEMRVGLTPASVLALVEAGHAVYIERDAGLGAGFSDEDYRRSGGKIVYSAAEAYGRADIVCKISRPTAEEYRFFHPGQTLLCFLHLQVASPDLLQALRQYTITAIAYEMLAKPDGRHPILLTASEVAGRMAPQIAAQLLQSNYTLPGRPSGLGILLSGLPGVPPATVVIVGGGVLGFNAARAFIGAGAEVIVLDKRVQTLRRFDETFGGRVTTMFSNEYNLKRVVKFADVLVGAVFVHGQRAPVLITREMVRSMRPGAVIIDFSIDQGGCVETSRPTTLRDPAYIAEGVVHHCVPNITATVARTTSHAVSNAALPYLLSIGQNGLLGAIKLDPAFVQGINLYQGKLVHPAVAAALGLQVEEDLERAMQESGGNN